jgi:site-specific DNA recombinase
MMPPRRRLMEHWSPAMARGPELPQATLGAKPTLKQETRDAILLVVAKARSWIDDVASGCIRSFAEIAEREGKVERHIRLLTPLAFIPPRALAAIIDGTGPHDATVTALAQAVPYRWDRSPAGQVSEQTPDDGR